MTSTETKFDGALSVLLPLLTNCNTEFDLQWRRGEWEIDVRVERWIRTQRGDHMRLTGLCIAATGDRDDVDSVEAAYGDPAVDWFAVTLRQALRLLEGTDEQAREWHDQKLAERDALALIEEADDYKAGLADEVA